MKYFFLFSLVIIVGCAKSKNEACPSTPQYQALTSSAKDWLPYSNNKGIAFENAALQRDTIDVLNLFIGDDSIWVGDKCPITRGQFIRVDFYDKRSKDVIRTQVGYQDEVRVFTKFTNLVFYDTQTILIEPSAYRRYSLSETLNGKAFTSVLSIECSPADNCATSGITKVFLAKSRGLVGYIRNGELWTLI